MNRNDSNTTIQELKDKVIAFREGRGWREFNTPKNLAVSIAIETAELLEHFQWQEYDERDKQNIADELADIVSNCFNFADMTGIDITSAFLDKLQRVSQKYPAKLFAGGKNKGDYRRIKQAHRERKGES